MEQRQTLDISWGAIMKVFLAVFAFYLFFLARNILIWFFFALIISLLANPAVNFLRKLWIPKTLAVVLVYLSVFGFLGLLIYLTAPIFILEVNHLAKNLPDYFEKVNPILRDIGIEVAHNFEDFSARLIDGLQESSGSIVKALSVFFGGVTSTAFIFTFAFFLSLQEKGPEHILALVAPKRYEHYIVDIFSRAQVKVAGWFGARILACLLVGAASFIVFFLFGVKYAFILALVSGVLNFIPYIGPTVTLILAVLFAGISNSWLVAAYIFVALLLIQEIENKFLTPLLMKKFMDMPPVLVLFALLVGQTIFGFLGMIFSVPVAGIIYEFLKDFLERRKQENSSYAQ